MKTITTYYALAKPGIVYGNVLTTLAAFLFASRFHSSLALCAATLLGIALVIGSGCVFNNYLDREIDKKMARTRERALVRGTVSVRAALIYATALGLAGLALLYIYVNALTALIALTGFVLYVVVYGYAKRTSHFGTEVGSLAGAVPIVVGYTAVTNRLDLTALTLFFILAFWQMPHFFAIATYRLEEYRAAGIPVLPSVKGIRAAKVSILMYLALFTLAALSLAVVASISALYTPLMALSCIWWLTLAARGLRISSADTAANEKWARSVFRFSLIILLVFCAVLATARIV